MAKDGQTIQWQKMDRQYNGKRRRDNTMAKDGQTIQWQKTDRQYNGKRKEVKRQTMVYKTVHRKLDQHGPNIYWGELRCFGRVALLASLLALIVLFGQYRDHDKRNISVIICDINTPQRLTKSGSRLLYTFDVKNPTLPLETIVSLASSQAATIYRGNHNRKH